MSTKMESEQKSVLARLMGFDELLPQQPNQKRLRVLSENYLHRVASLGFREKHSEQHSFHSRIEGKKDYPNIIQVLETLKRRRQHTKSVENRELHSRSSKESHGALELNDQLDVPCHLQPGHITILKPSDASTKRDIGMWGISEQSYINLLKEVEGGCSTYCREEVDLDDMNMGSQLRSCDYSVLKPTRIVVLKPHQGRVENAARCFSSSTSSNSGDGKHRQISGPWNKNLLVEVKERKKLENEIGPVRPRSRFLKQKTRTMVNGISSTMAGIPRSEIRSGEPFTEKPELSAPSSPILSDTKNQFHHSDGSYVVREAKEQPFERWIMSKNFQEVEFSGQNRTPAHVCRTINLVHKHDNRGVNNPVSLARGDVSGGPPLGVQRWKSRKAWDVQDTPRCRSLVNFKAGGGTKARISNGSLRYERYIRALESIKIKSRRVDSRQKDDADYRNLDSSCNKSLPIPTHLEAENNFSMETNCLNQSELENKHEYSCGQSPAGSMSSEQNNHALQDAWVTKKDHSNEGKDANLLEQNSVVDKMGDAETETGKGYYFNHKQQSQSIDYNFSEEDEDSSLPVLDTSDRQDTSIEIYYKESVSSHHSGTDPESLASLEEAHQCSPVSVLESLYNDEISSSPGFFQRVSTCLHGLNMQLELLKSEDSEAYSEELGMMVSSDEEGSVGDTEEKEDCMRFFGVEENWDFSYLVDALAEAGFHTRSIHMEFDDWDSQECPINSSIFETLEKKYGEQVSWKRSERRLLFDRINLGLRDIFHPLMGMSTWMKHLAKGFSFRQSQDEGIEEELWTLLLRQENEVRNDSQMVFGKDDRWLELGDDIQDIGREIENSLIDELVADVVSIQSFKG